MNYLQNYFLYANCESIQSMKYGTLDQTPGYPGLAQPYPHEVIPIKTPLTANGPPESPWQASWPPASKFPAQIILSVTPPKLA